MEVSGVVQSQEHIVVANPCLFEMACLRWYAWAFPSLYPQKKAENPVKQVALEKSMELGKAYMLALARYRRIIYVSTHHLCIS